MLIRLAWHWLGRWHEPLVVGAAVTLVGLAYFLPVTGAASPIGDVQRSGPQALSAGGVSQRPAPALRADAQYYRDQWARDAKQFYAMHPPRQPAAAAGSAAAPDAASVVPAAAVSFSDRAQGTTAVAHAYHAAGAAAGPAVAGGAPLAESTAVAQRPAIAQRIRRWRVVTCLAAGLLASVLFAALWPAVAEPGVQRTLAPQAADSRQPAGLAPPSHDPSRGEAIAIRLPAAWVRVRPTMRQTLRRGVLGCSYLLAALGGWGVFA